MQSVVVWGTGNMGATAIRSALAFPGLTLTGIITSSDSKVGSDAATFARTGEPTGVLATMDIDAALAGADAVAYMASGDTRPDEATNDIERCLRAGCHVVTPSIYALYDPSSAPAALTDRLRAACTAGRASLIVTGVDPGWANDALAVLAAGLCTRINNIRCQEIFDYSTYHQPHAVRVLCGFGMPMSEMPMMLLPGVPTMVWGGNIRLIARGLGIEIDEITESVEREPLARGLDNEMGHFDEGSQGAFRLQIIGSVAGTPRVIIDHITRIDPTCAPQWPLPDEGVGEHKVIVDGDPELTISVRADVKGGTRADGGNTTAANRLLGAISWLADADPDIYNGLDIPLNQQSSTASTHERWAH